VPTPSQEVEIIGNGNGNGLGLGREKATSRARPHLPTARQNAWVRATGAEARYSAGAGSMAAKRSKPGSNWARNSTLKSR
jgi:hypothetical protein